MQAPAEIKRSKRKTVKLLLMSLLLVAGGVFLLFIADDYPPLKRTLVITAGILNVVFFGFIAIAYLSELLQPKKGIVFLPTGFNDHSSILGGHDIKWFEVADIRTLRLYNQQMIAVILADPEGYIAKSRGLKKWVRQLNYRYYESPVYISANSLETDFDTLHRLMLERWQDYRRSIEKPLNPAAI